MNAPPSRLPANALYFGGYDFFSRQLAPSASTLGGAKEGRWERGLRDLGAGFGAELCAVSMWTPYDVLKQRMQVSEHRPSIGGAGGAGGAGGVVGAGGGGGGGGSGGGPTSILKLASEIYRTSGVRGFYVGLWAGVAVWGPYSAVFFSSYELMRDVLVEIKANFGAAAVGGGGGGGDDIDSGANGSADSHGVANDSNSRAPKDAATSTPEELLCGMVAGAVAAAVTQPIDCVKTRFQVNSTGGSGGGPPPTLWGTTAQVMREGRGALFRGTAARVMWLAPGSGMTMTIFEAVQRALKDV